MDNWFKDPAKAIKDWAKNFLIAGLVICILSTLGVLITFFSDSGTGVLIALISIIVEFGIIYRLAIMTYGLGEIVEKTTQTVDVLERIEKRLSETPESIERREIEEALRF